MRQIIYASSAAFFQVLEGSSEPIKKMKFRIWSDKRHRGITEFKDSEVSERSFPDWSMGCYRIKTAGANTSQWPIVDLNSIMDHMPETIAPDVLVLTQTFFQSIAPRGVR